MFAALDVELDFADMASEDILFISSGAVLAASSTDSWVWTLFAALISITYFMYSSSFNSS